MKPTGIAQALFFLTVAILLTGCLAARPALPPTPTASSTPTSTIPPTLTATPRFLLPQGAIVFAIDPASKFAGHVIGQGQTAIILANMSYGGETQWDPFVTAVDKEKFTVITFNYLRPDYLGAAQGVSTVLERLREAGFKRVVCIGASLGVSACGSIALEPEMVGLVMIAGPDTSSLATNKYPKLFIAAADDPWAKDTGYAYTSSDEPHQLLLFPGTRMHGTELFYSPFGAPFLQALLDFLNKLP